MKTKRFTKAHPAVKPSHKGRLHRALGIPEGEKIPISRIHAAERSSDAAVAKEARYAETMRGWNHKK